MLSDNCRSTYVFWYNYWSTTTQDSGGFAARICLQQVTTNIRVLHCWIVNHTPWKAWITNVIRRQDGKRYCVAAMHCIVVIWVPAFWEYLARNRLASMFDSMQDCMRRKTIIGSHKAFECDYLFHSHRQYLALHQNTQVSNTQRLDQRHFLALGENIIWYTLANVIAHRHVADLD